MISINLSETDAVTDGNAPASAGPASEGSDVHVIYCKSRDVARLAVDLPLEHLFQIVKLARVHEVQRVAINASDSQDDCGGWMMTSEKNASARELRAAIGALSKDEQAVLVALAWIGRSNFGPDEFDHALTMAFDRHGLSVPDYLLGLPMLAQALEKGASACCPDIGDTRLSASARDKSLLH